ncbi:MAG: zinc dependent phospholipase C family protein [Cytophagaceae bacterium]
MAVFYKKHHSFITEHAVDPDKRRYIIPTEAPKHYWDKEFFGDSILYTDNILSYHQAIHQFSEDSLQRHGSLPWNLLHLTNKLTLAFKQKDTKLIIKLSSDIGHYIGDLHVPLHTTKNYNGQLTGQTGIHGLWESRLPELFHQDYFFYTGKAVYIIDIEQRIWQALRESNQAVDSVLNMERVVSQTLPPSQQFTFEDRNGLTVKTYSPAFARKYHELLNGMVERRMCTAIHMLSSIWYTCWMNAGSPDLRNMEQTPLTPEEEKEIKQLQVLTAAQDCVH